MDFIEIEILQDMTLRLKTKLSMLKKTLQLIPNTEKEVEVLDQCLYIEELIYGLTK